MKRIVLLLLSFLLFIGISSCSYDKSDNFSVDQLNRINQESKLISDTSQEYVNFLNELDKLQIEFINNPTEELNFKIKQLEEDGLKRFPKWIKDGTELNTLDESSSSRSTYNPATWRDSVQAVGSYGFVTVWWTQPYLLADYYAIYRRSPGSTRYYLRTYLYNATDDYYRDYSVYSGYYYSYQATVYYDNGGGYASYYMNAFRNNIYVP